MENIENIQNTASTVKNDGLDDLFYRVELDEEESEHLAAEPYSYWKSLFKVFIRKPSAIISISVLIILLLCIFIIPSLAYEGAYSFNLDIKDLGPRIVGLLWGYLKKIDWLFVEIYNLVTNIPSLLIYMLLSIVFSTSLKDIPVEVRLVFSLTFLGWLGLALLIRNMVLIIDNREYNVASKTLGTPASRIMFRNYLPYILGVIITEFSLIIPGMVSSEVSLSYFGVGLPTKDISIGAILQNGIQNYSLYPWQLLAPAFVFVKQYLFDFVF